MMYHVTTDQGSMPLIQTGNAAIFLHQEQRHCCSLIAVHPTLKLWETCFIFAFLCQSGCFLKSGLLYRLYCNINNCLWSKRDHFRYLFTIITSLPLQNSSLSLCVLWNREVVTHVVLLWIDTYLQIDNCPGFISSTHRSTHAHLNYHK